MLIALDFPAGSRNQQEVAEDIMKDVTGKINIFMPRSLDEFIAKVKAYQPKINQHLVLLSSHYKFLNGASEATWRTAEYIFQSKGGAVWGTDPGRETLTFVKDYDYNTAPDRIASEGAYNTQRAYHVRAHSKTYIGRTSVDPHTLIVGFRPSFPASSKLSDFFIGSLPSDWWQGVAFSNTHVLSVVEKYVIALPSASIVTASDAAHEGLTKLNIEHGAVPAPSLVYKSSDPTASRRYGSLIRDTSRTGADNRKWRP